MGEAEESLRKRSKGKRARERRRKRGRLEGSER